MAMRTLEELEKCINGYFHLQTQGFPALSPRISTLLHRSACPAIESIRSRWEHRFDAPQGSVHLSMLGYQVAVNLPEFPSPEAAIRFVNQPMDQLQSNKGMLTAAEAIGVYQNFRLGTGGDPIRLCVQSTESLLPPRRTKGPTVLAWEIRLMSSTEASSQIGTEKITPDS